MVVVVLVAVTIVYFRRNTNPIGTESLALGLVIYFSDLNSGPIAKGGHPRTKQSSSGWRGRFYLTALSDQSEPVGVSKFLFTSQSLSPNLFETVSDLADFSARGRRGQ